LSQPELLARTYTSHVYKVRSAGETVVLKILSDVGIADEANGVHALQYFDGHGAIRLLRHDDGAMLLEYVDGGDLIPLVRAGKDDEATTIIADVLNELHLTRRKDLPGQLTPLRVRFRSLFAKADEDASLGDASLFVRGAAVAEDLLCSAGPDHVLHGDMHHENVRWHKDRKWLAFDPKGLVGDRAYDAANAICQTGSKLGITLDRDILLRRADVMSEVMKIDRDRLLSYVFVHSCLSACWSVEDGQDPSESLVSAAMSEHIAGNKILPLTHGKGRPAQQGG
jgi:streptomycin 6-kinase